MSNDAINRWCDRIAAALFVLFLFANAGGYFGA
jgi:hypothetical protein